MVPPVCGDLAETRRPGRHSIRSLSIGFYADRGVANAGALLAVLFLTAPLVLKAFAAEGRSQSTDDLPAVADRSQLDPAGRDVVAEGDVVDTGMVRELMAQPCCRHLWSKAVN